MRSLAGVFLYKTLPICLEKHFDIEFNFKTGKEEIIGQSFAYSSDVLIEECQRNNQNLDQYLSGFISSNLNKNRYKMKTVLWYSPVQDLFLLIGCSKGQKIKFNWLWDLPGRFDSGQAFIRPNAIPFIYWDGKNVYRIHEKPSDYQPGDYLMCDFAGMFRLTVFTTDRETYMDIKSGEDVRWDYSVIPQSDEEKITFQDRKYILTHAFYKFVSSPSQIELFN